MSTEPDGGLPGDIGAGRDFMSLCLLMLALFGGGMVGVAVAVRSVVADCGFGVLTGFWLGCLVCDRVLAATLRRVSGAHACGDGAEGARRP